MNIELDNETVTRIVTQELKESYLYMKKCYDNLVERDKVTGVFSFDPVEECEQLNKHLDGLEIVLNYYGVDLSNQDEQEYDC